MNFVATPEGTRYVPFTQQKSCCVPTCLQMVMYKRGIPLIPAEELGYHLGLVVSPERSGLFYKPRVTSRPPTAGYGTQIYNPEFEPNTIFKKLNIPLQMEVQSISSFSIPTDLAERLKELEAQDSDALLCFNHGALINDNNRNWGHVVVFDRIQGNEIRIIDPSPNHPKWRFVAIEDMFNAMVAHKSQNSAGIWVIEKVEE